MNKKQAQQLALQIIADLIESECASPTGHSLNYFDSEQEQEKVYDAMDVIAEKFRKRIKDPAEPADFVY